MSQSDAHSTDEVALHRPDGLGVLYRARERSDGRRPEKEVPAGMRGALKLEETY